LIISALVSDVASSGTDTIEDGRVAAHHDAVGVQRIGHRRPLAQKLGIAGHAESDGLSPAGIANALAHQRLHQIARPHRNGRFVHYDPESRRIHRVPNRFRRRLQVRQIGFARGQGRRAHRDKDNVARAHRVFQRRLEYYAAALRGERNHRIQVRFVNRRFAAPQPSDFGCIGIHTPDLVPQICQAHTRHGAHVSSANHGYLHSQKSPSEDLVSKCTNG
jgi:hypothetical protein